MRKMVHCPLPGPLHGLPRGYVTKNNEDSAGFSIVVEIPRRAEIHIQDASVLRDPLGLKAAHASAALYQTHDPRQGDLLSLAAQIVPMTHLWATY